MNLMGTLKGVLQLLVKNALKWLGYRLGKAHTLMPLALKRACAMHKPFWSSESKQQQA